MELTFDLAFAYACTLISACIPIYFGSLLGADKEKTETMSSKDAYMFPVIGSCVLFGLYMAFKLLSKEYVNMLLTAYFLIFGISAIAATLAPFCAKILGEKRAADAKDEDLPYHLKFGLPFGFEGVDWRFGKSEGLAVVLGVLISVWYGLTKHWVANNFFGFCFALQGVALISPGSYKVGAIMLSGLFFYDIFWVFGTDVMVTVAKSFDAPIKVVFPKNLTACLFGGEELKFSMLGLGDIVIPGLFIALLLRFDIQQAKDLGKKVVSRTYFNITMVGYFVGLLLTIVIMHVFEHAQPALLYLVPACLLFSFVSALIRGEVEPLLAYSEEIEEEDKEKVAEKKDAEPKKEL